MTRSYDPQKPYKFSKRWRLYLWAASKIRRPAYPEWARQRPYNTLKQSPRYQFHMFWCGLVMWFSNCLRQAAQNQFRKDNT